MYVFDFKPKKNGPDNSPVGLIKACLFNTIEMKRYFEYLER